VSFLLGWVEIFNLKNNNNKKNDATDMVQYVLLKNVYFLIHFKKKFLGNGQMTSQILVFCL